MKNADSGKMGGFDAPGGLKAAPARQFPGGAQEAPRGVTIQRTNPKTGETERVSNQGRTREVRDDETGEWRDVTGEAVNQILNP